MAETHIKNFQGLGTPEGNICFGDVEKNNAKMAVMIRRVFPNPKTGMRSFRNPQFIGLQMSGELDGAILNSAPSVYSILCGEKPVGPSDDEGISGIWYAENGDIVIGAPRGRLRIFAENIDILANGNGDDTGVVNVEGNAAVNLDGNNIKLSGGDLVGMESSKKINIVSSSQVLVQSGDVDINEGPDYSPITNPPWKNSGNITLKRQLEGYIKLIKDAIK